MVIRRRRRGTLTCPTYAPHSRVSGEWPHFQMPLSLLLIQRQFPSDIGYKIWKIWNVFIRILTRGRTQHRDIVPERKEAMANTRPQHRISIISNVVYQISVSSLHHKPVITDWSQNNKPPTSNTVHRSVQAQEDTHEIAHLLLDHHQIPDNNNNYIEEHLNSISQLMTPHCSDYHWYFWFWPLIR